jgi:RNA polymerase sigma-70 factor (ECF subfamily)
MPTSDELNELARAVALAGDRSAFAVLFKHFAPRVKAHLLRCGASGELAEELAQETLVSVWRKAKSFDPGRAQLSTWIFTIARNLWVDHLRRQPAPPPTQAMQQPNDESDPLEQVAHPAATLDEQLGTARREIAVRQALAQLAPEQQRIVWLSFYGEQSHARIAQELGVPLGTVKSRIRLAVSHLRRLLQGLDT